VISSTPHWASGHHVGLGYHRVLLDDPVRMDVYERAIRALVRPGDVVLDLGAGTGILAMLAARAGAARVHAVESTPIGALAHQLVAANGLEGRVIVHRADAVTLAPVEPVDLIIGDFLGRYLVDDGMLPAVAAAARWLKPGGRFSPSRVRLIIAPVGNFGLGGIDSFYGDFYGLDLSGAVPYALNSCYHGDGLDPSKVLAAPALHADFVPPGLGVSFDTRLRFTLHTGGHLVALAGWMEVDLAPGVTLSTGPGVDTHWGQHLFPMATTHVHPGDELVVDMKLLETPLGPGWSWSGTLRGVPFSLESEPRLGERPVPAGPAPTGTRDDVVTFTQEGADRFAAMDVTAALAAWRKAAPIAPADMASVVYENLGLGYLNAGQPLAAMRCFLRALDGELPSREQSLRLLIRAAEVAGRTADARRYTAAYVAAFGVLKEE
jgi:SAM-dependent methyltransferase